MIGKIYSSVVPFYDRAANRNSFKKRPVLILSLTKNNDYAVLPVSTISDPKNRDPEFDIEVKKADYPLLNLDKDSYIRTHKQTTIHRASVTKEISDLKSTYEDLYLTVLSKLDDFHKELINNALN